MAAISGSTSAQDVLRSGRVAGLGPSHDRAADREATEVQVTVHEAKTHLSRLLKEVEAGKTVVITRRGKPVAKLEAVRRRPKFGSMKGRISFDESFFDPLPEDELLAWEGG